MSLRHRHADQLESQLGEARRRIAELESELSRAATRDQLTQRLLTMRAFRAQLELDVQRAHRYERPLSLAVIDVDGFRSINAEHGYGAGDGVLVAVGAVIAELTRSHDLACRVGGDEFAMMLPETGTTEAAQAGERILRAIENVTAGSVGDLHASIGIAPLESEQTSQELLGAAHAALERARASGGGAIEVHAGA